MATQDITFWTTNFITSGSDHRDNDALYVAISRSVPEWYDKFSFNALAPTSACLSEYKSSKKDKAAQLMYITQYNNEILSKLNAKDIVDTLSKMAKAFGKHKIVLQCWEKPGEFCHRWIVAKWLTKNGYPTNELQFDK